MRLHSMAAGREAKDVEAETSASTSSCTIPPKDGLKMYWKEKNEKSIDGLPGLLSAYDSPTKFVITSTEKWGQDDESIPSPGRPLETSLGRYIARGLFYWTDVKLVLCFLIGWVACAIWTQLQRHDQFGVSHRWCLQNEGKLCLSYQLPTNLVFARFIRIREMNFVW
jgi:hypothetical protein